MSLREKGELDEGEDEDEDGGGDSQIHGDAFRAVCSRLAWHGDSTSVKWRAKRVKTTLW